MELRLEEPYAKLWKEYEDLYKSRPEYDEQVKVMRDRVFHSEERATAAKYPRMYSEIYNMFVKLKRVFKVKDISIIEDSYEHNLVCMVGISVNGTDYFATQHFHTLWYEKEILEYCLQDTVRMFSEVILKGD